MRLGTLPTTLSLGIALAVGLAAPSYAVRAPDERPAVVQKAVIGKSVQGRPIKAFRLGERGKTKVLLISTMHGDENDTHRILTSLRDRRPIHGLNLWVLPVYNPDGLARGTRKNAHEVDLNRNFPYRWADLDGSYESGPRAGSEPETRAVMKFLKKIRPRWIISFHQPLNGVDTDTKDERFAARVADRLNLPRKSFTCGGVCHGTMTGWYNHHFRGAALTVEYGSNPPRRLMQRIAPRQVLSIWGAHRR
ncbi:M14 family zinc carboxypeptidase [Nocardioides sp. SR21]|uniref:M14 family zinc carboxypeptidase n=1 Tax=Nocardioides sp. SR21 TaxID=2919501 RepID=UPI001FA949FD|nr:M14 family zinc carboxypeptidase [Nocardioides sp. SR21]